MRRFKINFDRIEARRNAESQQEENKRKIEDQKARDYAKKYPDSYRDIVAFDLPYKITDKGTAVKLVLSAIRSGNDDEDDDVNEVMLNIRTFIKKPDDKDYTPTKKGIYVPMRYANQIAATIYEILEELNNKDIKDIDGKRFVSDF